MKHLIGLHGFGVKSIFGVSILGNNFKGTGSFGIFAEFTFWSFAWKKERGFD